MTRHEQLQEQYEDALFALMMEKVAVMEGEKALAENERLKNDPDAEVPEEITKACMWTIRRGFAKQNARAVGRLIFKVFGRVAMVAGICAMLFTAAFAGSETVRVNTMNLVVEVFGESTDFYFAGNRAANTIPQVTAGWLPEGYTLKDQGENDIGGWWLYAKSENEFIKIKYTLSDGTVLSIDTENADTKNVQINGTRAKLVQKGSEQQLVWGTEDKTAFVQVTGTSVTSDELIHVANELEY